MSESENSSVNEMIWNDVWLPNQKWRDDLAKKAAHKSVGIPEEMGDIGSHNTTVNHGSSLRDIVAAGLVTAALLGSGAGFLAYQYLIPKAEEAVKTVIEKQVDIWDYKVEMEVDRKPSE